MDSHVTENESIGGLIRGILRDFRTLVDEEVALARLELQEQVGRVRTAAVSLSIAAVALLMGGAFILVALATAIADLLGWPVWSGFLIVALVMTAIGVITLMMGRTRLRAVNMVPDKTIESVKENAEWISKRLSSARR
jgi:hypothetical protein